MMRWNIVFNYVSRLFSALSMFFFVPAYIALLGADGYSVIALSILVVSLILVLEVGLTQAVSREMARQDITDNQRRRAFIAIERLFLAICGFAMVLSLLFSGDFVNYVVGETNIEKKVIAICVSLIGMEAGLQLLLRFHISVLIGLERQVRASLFNIIWASLRNGVVVAVIWFYPNLYVFFAWQLAATFMIVLALKFHSAEIVRSWPITKGLFLDFETLRRLRGFAGGMLLISLVAVANTQLDRLLIGSMASLRELGAYTLAATLGTAMLIAATPIMVAVQPRLTSYFTLQQTQLAIDLFRRSTRGIALLVVPPAVIIALHPEIVLNAWIADADLAQIASQVVPFLVAANVSIAIATTSHAVAIAKGYTRYSNIIGIFSLVVSIPGYFLALKHYGIVGVSFVYFVVQLVSTLSLSWLLMRRFLKGGFLLHNILTFAPPIAGALLGAWIFSSMLGGPPEGRLAILVWLFSGVLITGLSGAGLATTFWRITDRW